MATIDRLDIQIEGSAQKANVAINDLIKNLGRLANSLKIDTSGLEKIGKSLNFIEIDKAAKNMQFQMSNTEKVALSSISKISSSFKKLREETKESKVSYLMVKDIQMGLSSLEIARQKVAALEKAGATASDTYKKSVDELKKLGELEKINVDTSSIDKINEKITELKNRFDKTGMDFKFTGNFEQLNIEIKKLHAEFDKLKKEEQELISGGKVDTLAFKEVQRSLSEVGNKIPIMEDLRDRTEAFNQSLQNLKVPPINEENLTKLQIALKRTEADTENLRIKLSNAITMGRIIPNVDDSGFRKLTEQIALSEKQTEALKEKIGQIGKTSGKKALLDISSVAKKAKSALSGVASVIKKVGLFSGAAISKLSNFARKLIEVRKASKSVDSATNLLKNSIKEILKYFSIIESAKGIKNAIKDSIEYIETLNYFEAAFGQVASNADLSAFEKMGYDSADAYYKSFAQRAEELTSKMSGFAVGEGGLLQSTRSVSLGLDPSQLMNYQAMFGQMASSMGLTSETSLKLSQALTEIGADLASVRNMDFENVWNDMASGLAGMSRTLDKYGVNIRNVNLQQKLNELGIKANIQALNQNEKALLRTIILLENTKYAWGDLADTINQPANQLRLIEANFQNLSRTIGNLFLPIVKTVLPYVNSLVIAFQRLFAWLGNLLGIDISNISTSIGGTDIGGILDQTDDLSDSLGGVAENAKKAKAGLRSFDELKTISMPEESKGGGGAGGIGGGLLDSAFEDAFSKYQEEWDKAFAGMENRAQEMADRIEKAFEPLKEVIKSLLEEDFFGAGENFGEFINSILALDWNGVEEKFTNFSGNLAEFANGIISETDFELLGSDINTGLEIVFNTLIEFIDTFDFEELGKKVAKGIKSMFPNSGWWSRWGTWIGGKFKAVILTMKGFVEEMSVIDPKTGLTGWQQLGIELGNGINNLFNEIPWETLGETFAGLFNGLFELGGKFLETVEFDKIGSSVGLAIKTGLDKIDWETVKETVGLAAKQLATFLNNLITPENMESVGISLAETLNTAVIAVFDFFNGLDFENLGESFGAGVNGFTKTFDFKKLFATIDLIITKLKDGFVSAVSTIEWGDLFSGIFEGLGEISIGNISLGIALLTIKYAGKKLTQSILGGILTKQLVGGAAAAGGASVAGSTAVLGGAKVVGATVGGSIATIALPLAVIFGVKTLYDFSKDKKPGEKLETEGLHGAFESAKEGTLNDWLMEENRKLGITVDETEGPISKVKEKWKSLTDSANNLGKEIDNSFQTATLAITDFLGITETKNVEIESAFSGFGKGAESANELAGKSFDNLKTNAAESFLNVSTKLSETNDAIKGNIGEMKKTITEEKIGEIPSVDWSGSIETNRKKMEEIANEGISSYKKTISNGENAISGRVSSTFKSALDIAKKNSDMLVAATGVATASINKMKSEMKDKKNELSTAASDAIRNAMESAKSNVSMLNSAANVGTAIGNKIMNSMQSAISSNPAKATVDIPGRGKENYEINLTGFASGGFPKPFSIFAAGEGGISELIGTVGGKTAVAGGAEITGIRDAIKNASNEEIQLMREQNELLRLLLEKDTITTEDIGRAARKYSYEYYDRNKKPAYMF